MAQTPPDDASTTNRLANESSPYLLLHQHNPVDWYPWGEEAIDKARSEDKPIFLSVGYSTCYWCHVMERESFSDPGVARLMNDRFVNVKVDREERPDVDEIYMTATQILTSHGGWPNSVFLTPDLEPFYAGTYFPPEERHGRPSFAMVLAGLADAWENRQKEVLLQAEEMGRAMRRVLEERFPAGDAPAAPGAAVAAARALGRTFDAEHGGFGKAPKFPTPSNLYLLTELARADALGGESLDLHPEAGEMLTATLDAMARGGLYDQLGGGFHRYSTDARWQVPHFEKMLYDNGFLLELFAREHARTGDPQAARIVRETADWLGREMTSPEGAFWSAIDAETDGREGAFYAWSGQQLEEVLGDEDFQFLAPLYGFDGEPFFEGDYVLHLPRRLDEQAASRRITRDELLAEIAPLRQRLFEARARRDRPATDDKILTDWNGMAIRGLAIAGRLLDDPSLVERAERAGRAVVELATAGDVLLHSVREGVGRIEAYLSDYVFLAWGFLALADGTGDEHWVTEAIGLVDEMDRRLSHPDGGWYNAAEAPDLLVRSQEIFDGATPAANAVAVLVLLDLGRRTGEPRYRAQAEQALAAFSPVVEQSPEAVRMLSVANRRFHEPAWGAPWPPPGLEDQAPRPARKTAQETEAEAAVTSTLELGEPDDGDGSRTFTLALEIAPGWHVNAHETSDDALVPTTVEAEGAEILDVTYPPGRSLAAGDGEISVYQGTVAIRGRLRGGGRLVLSFQPCDDERCLPPVRRMLKLGP